MQVTRIDDGLWRWTAPHPDWKQNKAWGPDVGCVYWEGPDAIVLVDPQLPSDNGDLKRFLDTLDRDVERVGMPVVAMTTCAWHARSATDLAARYGGRVIDPEIFDEAMLPSGVKGVVVQVADEIVYWLEGARSLVPGDTLLGNGSGGVEMCPASWLDSGGTTATLRAELSPVLELAVERVLVSHGEPVLNDGLKALREALVHASA